MATDSVARLYLGQKLRTGARDFLAVRGRARCPHRAESKSSRSANPRRAEDSAPYRHQAVSREELLPTHPFLKRRIVTELRCQPLVSLGQRMARVGVECAGKRL